MTPRSSSVSNPAKQSPLFFDNLILGTPTRVRLRPASLSVPLSRDAGHLCVWRFSIANNHFSISNFQCFGSVPESLASPAAPDSTPPPSPRRLCTRYRSRLSSPKKPQGRLVTSLTPRYNHFDFGKAENRFLRGNLEREESPNTKGRDAA